MAGAAMAAGATRAVWRWHFWAGLFCAPLLIVLTLSGALYLFDREIDGWWNRSVQTVAVRGTPLPLAAQEAALRTALPDAVPLRVRLPHRADEAAIWTVRRGDGQTRQLFIDPYSGALRGDVDPAWQPMPLVRRVHGTLLGGEVGSYVVELIACWTLVMLATGVWLWWPRRWKWRGVLVPRLWLRGRRFWRDLHAIPGIVIALLVAGLVLSGLPWSAFWGVQFARAGAVVPFIAPSPNFRAPPSAPAAAPPAAPDPHAQHRMAMPDNGLPWTMRHTPMPMGGAPRIGIAEVEPLLARLDRAHFGPGVRITYPDAPGDVFIISYVPDKAEGQRTLYIDPADGHVLGDIGWADYSPVAKIVEWGVMTHMGRQYGLANQLANLAVCLALVGAVAAGLILWWRRRPPGSLAPPPRHAGDRLPPLVVAMLAGLGLLFPLVGASLLLVLAAEAIVRSRARPQP